MTMMEQRLASGYAMPVLGLGTWAMDRERIVEAVTAALEVGYTHIDTACVYGNQPEIGRALHQAGVDRSGLFLTSKVPREALNHDGVVAACDQALSELQCGYLDLFLLHWPNPDVPMADSLGALGELVGAGKVRSIGVSNFALHHLEEALRVSPVPLSVNQVEYHTHLNQQALLDYCTAQGIHVTAYCPIGRGRYLSDPVLAAIARECGCSPAQVALRWLLQKGLSAVPKATSREHLGANYEALHVALGEDAMARIDGIAAWNRCVAPAFADLGD